MNNKCCDLHTHSYYSDGSYTPAQLIDEAVRCGLSAVALTDHNTTAGLPELLAAAKARGIEAIPGVEFSTDYGETELHIVALFVQPQHYEAIERFVLPMKQNKERSNRTLIESLNRAGYALDYDEIMARSGGQINRSHVASALTEKGYTASVAEAFATVLSKQTGHYQQPLRLPVLDTIDFIKSIGAVAVWAHPFLDLDEQTVRAFLEQAIPHGLDAMETRYSTYAKETEQKAIALAEEYGILQSGGSDFHGKSKPTISLGTGEGSLTVPYALLQQLKAKIS
ncbi:MAG: PHP domain-containing protein [Clostridia bacterium]|nr:PHP domain-containing protein [Clostridia bacterium]